MYNFPIGVIVDSFRTDIKSAIVKASEIGADGIQMYATSGAYSPESLGRDARRELLDYVKAHGLKFSALCGDLGMGFFHPEKNAELIEKSKRILDLAKELETDVVTTHIGVVPEDESVRAMRTASARILLSKRVLRPRQCSKNSLTDFIQRVLP